MLGTIKHMVKEVFLPIFGFTELEFIVLEPWEPQREGMSTLEMLQLVHQEGENSMKLCINILSIILLLKKHCGI